MFKVANGRKVSFYQQRYLENMAKAYKISIPKCAMLKVNTSSRKVDYIISIHGNNKFQILYPKEGSVMDKTIVELKQYLEFIEL